MYIKIGEKEIKSGFVIYIKLFLRKKYLVMDVYYEAIVDLNLDFYACFKLFCFTQS